MPETALVRFYGAGGTDHAGRTLDEILAWDDWHLEDVHDYIQWLFPLEEPSRANPSAPLLTPEDIASFTNSPRQLEALHRAFVRILAFYGFEAIGSGGDTVIRRSSDWPSRSANWLRPSNHNHLRLTRIMKSLSLLGMSGEARALSLVLLGLAADPKIRAFSRTTVRLWQEASLGTGG
jgi:opioid growth factor receptor-like protein